MLTSLLLTPFAGALVILAIPGNYRVVLRAIAALTALLTLFKAIALFASFNAGAPGFQFEERAAWAPSVGLAYHLGLDGLNVGLVLMTACVAFAAIAVSGAVQNGVKLYYFLLLVIAGGALGAFLSLDLFSLYFFNEIALAPTFILMGAWGSGPDKAFATFQMAIYLTLGALVALAGLAALYSFSGANTLDAPALAAWTAANPMPASVQKWLFPALFLGFGTLVGLWPFHSWAPAGYSAAPTAAAMIHAGVLKKVGLYALLRAALPLLPAGFHSWAPVMAGLGLMNLVYCGWVAMRQRDLALLIGNSSLAHMGFCFLGLASGNTVAIAGVVLLMVAHGFLAALEFAVVGHLRQAAGSSQMDKLGGLLRPMPFVGAVAIAALMAGCGLPGFANFAGEFTVLLGAWKAWGWPVSIAAWAGVIIGGVYMLRAIRAVCHGTTPAALTSAADAGSGFDAAWRRLPYIALLAPMVWFGVTPDTLVSRVRPAAEAVARAAASGEAARPGVVEAAR